MGGLCCYIGQHGSISDVMRGEASGAESHGVKQSVIGRAGARAVGRDISTCHT